MGATIMLNAYLQHAVANNICSASVVSAITALSDAAQHIAGLAARTGLANSDFGALAGSSNSDGDDQKALDVLADTDITARLKQAGAAIYLSEEQDTPILLNPDGDILVAADPLDGSSNIDTNLTIGTIFSIYPAPEIGVDAASVDEGACLISGREQLAAGFFVYGPQTGLLLTLGDGVAFFVLDADGVFQKTDWVPDIPAAYPEFAMNMSNKIFWPEAVSAYIAGLQAGKLGPAGKQYNMKWCASLVADAFRIFRRGGIFLYPQDSRPNYEEGRLRLIYEAHPIAFLVEQAGGRATDGTTPIMDKIADSLHARTPFIFGSADEVTLYESVYQTGQFPTD